MASTSDNSSTPRPHYDIDNIFCYRAPRFDQTHRYYSLREAAKSLAQDILDLTPPSREQSLALTKLEEAVMWANAAIARNEPDTTTSEQVTP